ncbi:MAG: fibronectin type III domain-containing protein [Bacteroidetes bacterium]|nr:fibronectin type III domain-containing protein [Bacteroidota bacterium]
MKMKIKYLTTFIIALSINFVGCVNSPTSPDSLEFKEKGSIKIFSPISNDSVGYEFTSIKYTITQVEAVDMVELYINNKYVINYRVNRDPISNALAFQFDPSLINLTFSYFLKYYDTNGTSATSDTMVNIVITEPRIKPSKPFDVKLLMLQGPSTNSFNISWQDNPQNEVSYEVWRRDGFTADYIKILGPLPPGTFNVNDNGLFPNMVYYYKVRGQNKFGFSEFSDEVNTAGAGGGGGSGGIAPPTNLSGVALSSTVVKLIWQDNSYNENYFKIERNDNWTVWSKFETIATVPSNITTFTDDTKGLAGGHEFLYRIKAYSNTDSSWSNVASVTTQL